jgi:hypothetical protein
MTPQARRTRKSVAARVKRYAGRIRKKAARAGRNPDAAVVFSAAKYFKTLEKLAKE